MKKYIIRWLGLDDKIKSINQEIYDLKADRSRILKILETAALATHEHKQAIDKIRSLIHVGVDVNRPPRFSRTGSSWGVICCRGKREGEDMVEFFELRFEYYEDLKRIIQRMDGFNRTIDLPHPIRSDKDFFI